jgi:lysine-N-methylase
MTLPIRLLPITEAWDCNGCGRCCRGTIIRLNEGDQARLREQRWEQHPDFRGQKIMVRHGLWKPQYSLAKRKDGRCIFLEPDGLCRIHREFGLAAKPLICQMFPFQLVPLDDHAGLTLRRFCPLAAADHGRNLAEYLDDARRMAEQGGLAAAPGEPPSVAGRRLRRWPSTLRVADRIEQMMRDERYPLVRRIVHGLMFCDSLQHCRLENLAAGQSSELLALLENAAVQEAGGLFRPCRPPRRAAGMLFRQTALEYARLHPLFDIEASWRERWRLVCAAMAFARGRGPLPAMHSCFPSTTFEALERPLGPLDAAVLRPLAALFEATAASKYYAMLGRPGWSLIDSFRALALAYPLALWLLRLRCGDRRPQVEDMIDVVGAIDRGQSYPLLAGRRHRRRVRLLARRRELARLVIWYGQ